MRSAQQDHARTVAYLDHVRALRGDAAAYDAPIRAAASSWADAEEAGGAL